MIKHEKGFTLAEVMLVIAALCIVSYIALPNIWTSIENSRKATDLANAKLIYNASKQVIEKNSELVPSEEMTIIVTESELRDGSSHEALKKALLEALNKEVPVPKYRSDSVGPVKYFVIKIDQGGNIAVVTGSDITDFKSLELAPVADEAFQPK